MRRACAWCAATALSLSAAVAQPTGGQPPQLPLQHIVFVIDNSSSMENQANPSDPLRLRGVAASLILDAAELASNVEAGLVFFSDGAESDGRLHPPDVIRQRLQSDGLPASQGGTNMHAGLERAISMFSGSAASIKKIVLITDGEPDAGQSQSIVGSLVPHAQQAGIQIFALGLSRADTAFLDQLTLPTHGRTLLSPRHQELLQRAKELIAERDNVYTLVQEVLQTPRTEYEFELPPGADRARLTTILDRPQEFGRSEIEFTLEGPDAGDPGRPYVVDTAAGDRVAAWTTFFRTPGKYTLRVATSKLGVSGHLGLKLMVEALSTLRIALRLNPPDEQYGFGDEVEVQVEATSGSGTVDPATLRLSATVSTPAGGGPSITFIGLQGRFRVPDVAGRHTLVVKAETSQRLGRAQAAKDYTAVPPDAAQLKSSRPTLAFVHPLGPDRPQVEEGFKVFAEFPEGVRRRPVKVSATWISPVGEAELIGPGEASLRRAPALYTVPPEGLELRLRVKMDPTKPLKGKSGKHPGEIRLFSQEAGELVIPFQLEERRPKFELKGAPKALTLWWDPWQPRQVSLGRVVSDLSTPSTFTVTVPEALLAPGQGAKIADLALRIGGEAREPEPVDAGKLRYGPIDLPPGEEIPLDLLLTPTDDTQWERLAASRQPVEVQLRSDLGMEAVIQPAFWTVGGLRSGMPLLGPWSRHGRHLAVYLLCGGGLLLVLYLFVRRGLLVRRFWRFRSGSLRSLGMGAIQIGEAGTAGAAALLLPNSGSELDDRSLARVWREGNSQHLDDLSEGRLLLKDRQLTAPRRLAPGDVLGIEDPRDPEGRLWELDYNGFDPQTGEGELEVSISPAPFTAGRLARKLVVGLLLLALLKLFLGWGWVTELAYRLPLIEAAYVRLLS